MSDSLVKPRALKPGATLAVLSPASTPKRELVESGVANLHKLGYKTVVGAHALDSGPLYYAGTLEERLHDLHAAFDDAAVDGILCTRGGWGSAELLPHLDAKLIRAKPKPFIGYSDHTSLHCWLRNEANLITFYGPMAAADFSRADGVDIASWERSLGGDSQWSLGEADGLRILRPGRAEGTLTGGCLSIFAEALGTPYAPRIESRQHPFPRRYRHQAVSVGSDAPAPSLLRASAKGDRNRLRGHEPMRCDRTKTTISNAPFCTPSEVSKAPSRSDFAAAMSAHPT